LNYLTLFVAIALVACGQITQKLAAAVFTDHDQLAPALVGLLKSRYFWLSMLFMAAGLAAWLLALSSIEVSTAYPLLGLNFAITALLSRWLLGEQISAYRWLGIALISLGAGIMLIEL
jgi:multidrug transporter EmrE-like cation transporter